ncbi:hypothetical protein ACFBZI_08510 [Moraxella sp. ZJ142]|uniref:hypothetical protein n=1 Tax=Moraxella marmotae TaxID=3344520 RepID=UPI0035D45961
MNWQKYTIDEWLTQFGAWCNTCMMKGGHLPDGLHENQIYWLMQSVEPRTSRHYPRCEISDDEAGEINLLLIDGMQILPNQVTLVIEHKVHGRSLRELMQTANMTHNQVYTAVLAGQHYLAGLRQIKP